MLFNCIASQIMNFSQTTRLINTQCTTDGVFAYYRLDVFLLSSYTNGHLGQWWDENIKEMPLGDLPTMTTPLVPNGGSVPR
jgi:hypothetical protein